MKIADADFFPECSFREATSFFSMRGFGFFFPLFFLSSVGNDSKRRVPPGTHVCSRLLLVKSSLYYCHTSN